MVAVGFEPPEGKIAPAGTMRAMRTAKPDGLSCRDAPRCA